MTRIFLILSSVAFLVSCSGGRALEEIKMSSEEAPFFLKTAGEALRAPEYFRKMSGYEVKEAKGEKEISLAFDQRGKLIEKEEDVPIESLDKLVRSYIVTYIYNTYPKAKVVEIERRTNSEGVFIDVEIRDRSSPTGYWELSFNAEGKFVFKELENREPPNLIAQRP
jgi:hypothetical protein